MRKPLSSVGDGLEVGNANWRFQGKVVDEFDGHVEKSVPLYRLGQDLIAKVSDYFVNDGSVLYDLGCSTGEVALKLAQRHAHRPNLRVIGIDVEPEMVAKAQTKATALGVAGTEFVADDLVQMEFEPCDMVCAYYTIQFIRPAVRQQIFDKIYNALNWGGALLLFEKVRAPDARMQDISTSLYHDFKTDNGYSDDEIMGKLRSLKGVLEPFSTQGNIDLMQRAGFVDIMTIQKYVCFEGFLAIK